MPRVSSGMVDPDPRIAVVALELEREAEVERGALVRFGHDAGVLGEDSREKLRERLPQAGRRTIWRVGEYEVVGSFGAAQEGKNIAVANVGVDADCLGVARHRGGVRVDERGVSSAA